MAVSIKFLSHRSPLYTILFLLICFCIWEAFGFIIVSKRELTSLASHHAGDVTENGARVSTERIDSKEPSEDSDKVSRVYCIDGDCTCRAVGCYQCSDEEKAETSVLGNLCISEKSYQRFQCEGSDTTKYASCHNERLTPFRTVEEVKFLKFEVVCFMIFVLSYVVVWSRSKVKERVIIKRIQKLTEEPIS